MKTSLFNAMCRSWLAMLAMLLVAPAHAQFRVEVSGVGLTQVPLAVMAFRGEDSGPQKISAIVLTDLERSGQFRGVDSAGAVGDELSRPDFSVWRQKNADALIAGSVTKLADGRFDVRVRLWDVVRGQDQGGQSHAVVVGDYGKGVVTQALLDGIRERCKQAGCWISVDPKPVHSLNLRGLSLITPNRKEAFELARIEDSVRASNPMSDAPLQEAVRKLQETLRPALLLITLGELGMLLCRRDQPPFHVPTVAREVFDVSGAGDTVIAAFTLAIAAGATPIEATVFSNHAAGVVVGKRGTATVSPDELLATFNDAD